MPLGCTKPRKITLSTYPDTGAEQSVVSKDLVQKMGLVVDEDMSKTLKAVDVGTLAGHVPKVDKLIGRN